MEEEKKEKKERTSMTLKPINKRWLEQKSFEESAPGYDVSSSEIVDRLIDAARQADEAAKAKSPTANKQKKSATALELATA
jgi:hypothetical protein